MKDLGFTNLKSDAGLFIYRDNESFVIAIIYVDDSIFCGPNKDKVLALKQQFMQKMGNAGFRGCNGVPQDAYH
jgi:hypothetical protein